MIKNRILLLLVFCASSLMAQTKMNIYYTNGNIFSIPITTIDSIYYTLNTNVCPAFVMDFDSNIYNVVTIGNQCWMKENLKTSHYKNGAIIPNNLSDAQWQGTLMGASSDYGYDTLNTAIYGKLYNWYAVADPRGLCPAGWHEPLDWEWNVLGKFLDPNLDTICMNCNQSVLIGGALKETGTVHWSNPNTGATNSIGFKGLPAGDRYPFGAFDHKKYYAFWWSASTSGIYAVNRNLEYSSGNMYKYRVDKKFGYSVRCVKD